MCGRFTQMYTWKELVELYRLTLDRPPTNLRPRYNICPTTTIDTVRTVGTERVFEPMRWGLVPAWWQKPIKAPSPAHDLVRKPVPTSRDHAPKLATFNARVETVTTKPFFRDAFRRNRCLIPASGYYEWHTIGKEKQPYYFTRRDGSLLTIAGLWDEWHDPETGQPLHSCTMIIGEPNAFVAEIHDRMPVILEPAQFGSWLSGEAGLQVLKPAAEEVLNKHPVSKRVNSSRTSDDDHTLIEEVALSGTAPAGLLV